jgi:hypothetical protein
LFKQILSSKSCWWPASEAFGCCGVQINSLIAVKSNHLESITDSIQSEPWAQLLKDTKRCTKDGQCSIYDQSCEREMKNSKA